MGGHTLPHPVDVESLRPTWNFSVRSSDSRWPIPWNDDDFRDRAPVCTTRSHQSRPSYIVYGGPGNDVACNDSEYLIVSTGSTEVSVAGWTIPTEVPDETPGQLSL